MSADITHLLFCDYEGEFPFSETLSKLGFLVDHIRPEALRHVTVGDHQVYIFAFHSNENAKAALLTCDRLKGAALPTAIVLLHMGIPTPEFMNHQTGKHAADAYVTNSSSITVLLDALDRLVGCPIPITMKGSLQLLQDDKERRSNIDSFKSKVATLESKIRELEGVASLKPKLQAILKGQKLQFQTETERLMFQNSELEAQLLDREVKIKELENFRDKHRIKTEELTKSHEKSQQALREFYQQKIKNLGGPDKV
jgi:hypothetical protein